MAGLGSCIVGYTAKSCIHCCIVARRAHHTQSMGAALCWCLLGLGETPEGVYGVPELWRGVGMHDVTDPCPVGEMCTALPRRFQWACCSDCCSGYSTVTDDTPPEPCCAVSVSLQLIQHAVAIQHYSSYKTQHATPSLRTHLWDPPLEHVPCS